MAAAPCRELTGLRRGPAAVRPGPVPGRRGANELCLAPFHHRAPQQMRRLKVVAAISEDLPRLAAPGNRGAAEGRRPEKVLVRAALTVRRKHREDLKEALAGHLDALWDMVWLLAIWLYRRRASVATARTRSLESPSATLRAAGDRCASLDSSVSISVISESIADWGYPPPPPKRAAFWAWRGGGAGHNGNFSDICRRC